MVGLAAVVLLVGAGFGAAKLWQRSIDQEATDLVARSFTQPSDSIGEQDLTHLPEPVQRWLRWSQVVGKSRVSVVVLEQSGEFRLGPDKGWMDFTATQTYTVDPPGFVWAVSMEMFPLVSVSGRDMYADGDGSIDMRALGLVPVASEKGGSLDQGAALRYLNEIMWFPTAALSPQISWEASGQDSAIATFSNGDLTVSAEVLFDSDGRLVTMTADRYNSDKDAVLPWSTPIDAYGEFGGFRIPVSGRGIWEYPDGPFKYVRLTIDSVTYDPE